MTIKERYLTRTSLCAQTIGKNAISAVLAIDFWCASCFMDLGPGDFVNLSIYRLDDTDQVCF